MPTGTKFDVAFANTNREFMVDGTMIEKYTSNNTEQFQQGTEIPLLYLPENPSVVLPADLLNNYTYRSGPVERAFWGLVAWIIAAIRIIKEKKAR